jgi:putative addiction module component (TIGR02574 family)
MKLSDAERVELADRLLSSIAPERQAEVERAWAAEADRRYLAYKAGALGSVDYREAMRSIRERLK